jgi:hypothetical protein
MITLKSDTSPKIFQQGKFFVRYTKDVEENILLYKGFEVKSQL